MQTNRPLNQFLPVRFGNGNTISQFSKPCLRCGQILHAKHMHGIARRIENHLALSAQAHCPACQTRFAVSCVIDADKRVRKVILPHFLFKAYLRVLPITPDERNAAPALSAEPIAPPRVVHDYPRAEHSVGQFQGKPIPAYIVVDSTNVPFDRVQESGIIAADEYQIDGCFVYKAS